MSVVMVQVRPVGVIVRSLVVLMDVAVLAFDHVVMDVVVVAVIMAVRVLVFEPLVGVPVVVLLREMEIDRSAEERGRGQCGPARGAFAEAPRGRSADEGREREDRSRPTGSEATLRQEVQP